jgi:hypothetical protein
MLEALHDTAAARGETHIVVQCRGFLEELNRRGEKLPVPEEMIANLRQTYVDFCRRRNRARWSILRRSNSEPRMSLKGHNPKLPHRNITVRFSSNSRHYQERCSTPHAAVAPNLVRETRSGDSENPGAWASLASTFTRGAGMVYALLMPLPLGRRVAGHNSQPKASLQRGGAIYYIAISITYVFAVLF